MDNKILVGLVCATLLLAVGVFMKDTSVEVRSVDGQPVQVVERDGNVGAFPGDEIYNEVGFLGGLRYTNKIVPIAKTLTYATTTLTAKDSGTIYMLSASGTTMVLPAVTTKGATFTFTVKDAIDTGNAIVKSAEGDNMSGTLIVAGAVVDCRDEDFINFIADGEADGDTVTVMSDGTQWLIADSNVLTASKMTCTDPS